MTNHGLVGEAEACLLMVCLVDFVKVTQRLAGQMQFLYTDVTSTQSMTFTFLLLSLHLTVASALICMAYPVKHFTSRCKSSGPTFGTNWASDGEKWNKSEVTLLNPIQQGCQRYGCRLDLACGALQSSLWDSNWPCALNVAHTKTGPMP